ncbi:MAG TPA: hypothetical protein VHJ17_22855 [Thermomonospora sp.]|nr:hypothetical protein [Thermomonospora sp.]
MDIPVLPAPPTGRARAMAALCSGVAAMNAAMSTASAAGTLVAGDRLGVGWGGVPNMAGIVGTGVGALLLTRLMRRRSRRAVLVTGYAAAEWHPPHRRGRAIGVVVWSAALGAVGGPLLLDPSGDAAEGLGLAVVAGPFLVAAVTSAVAVSVAREGAVDAVTWSVAAVAGLLSTVVLSWGGYRVLAVASGVLAVLVAVALRAPGNSIARRGGGALR